MGVVYSPEVVAEGRVPEVGAQYDSAQKLMDDCAEWSHDYEPSDDPHPKAWMVYGSVPGDEATVRSDIDFLVVFERAREVYVRSELVTLVNSVQSQFNVFVEHNLYCISDAVAGRHNFDRLFVGNLLESERNARWSSGKPASYFDPGGIGTETLDEVREIILAYADAKAKKFTRAKTAAAQDLHSLQRAFELPRAFDHKFARLADLMDMSISPLASPLQELYTVHPPASKDTPNVATHLQWLNIQDRDYSGLLQLVIEGQMTLEDYIEWLDGKYEESLDHAFKLSLGVLALLDGSEV